MRGPFTVSGPRIAACGGEGGGGMVREGVGEGQKGNGEAEDCVAVREVGEVGGEV